MSSNSVNTLILTAMAVISLGSITLGASMLDRLVGGGAPVYSLADPDAASADVPRHIRPAPARSLDDIWSFEFD
jgi:hypothetical protein